MSARAITNKAIPEERQCSVHVPIDQDEAYSIVADPGNFARWWFRPGCSLTETGAGRVHFDSDPAHHLVDLRWGEDGDWRHVRIAVESEGEGSRVTMAVLPVPGCPTGCLEKEAIRASRDLKRLKAILRSRSHLLDSDDFWI